MEGWTWVQSARCTCSGAFRGPIRFPLYVWSPPQESPDGGYLHRLQPMADIFSLFLRPLVPRRYPYFSQIREYQRMIDQRFALALSRKTRSKESMSGRSTLEQRCSDHSPTRSCANSRKLAMF